MVVHFVELLTNIIQKVSVLFFPIKPERICRLLNVNVFNLVICRSNVRGIHAAYVFFLRDL